MVRRNLAMAAALAMSMHFAAPVQAGAQAEEIAYLLGAIRHSDCIFIRSGSEYDAAAAADHVQAKYNHFKGEILTAEDFIDRAATKSILTGEPYRMRCGNRPAITAAEWLGDLLRSYRAREADSP